MTHVTYKIVEHDGGWAYTVNGVFSEPFPNRATALAAARRVAAEQRVPGRTEAIEYETADGRWHSETAAGNDRPETEVAGIGGTQCRPSGDGNSRCDKVPRKRRTRCRSPWGDHHEFFARRLVGRPWP